MPPLTIVPLGGCPLNLPLRRLSRRGVAVSVYDALGFAKWPMAHTAGHALQLVRMTRGDIVLPPNLRDLCYPQPPARMPPDSASVLAGADLVLIEMSTSVETGFDGFIFNQNCLRAHLRAHVETLGKAAIRAANGWLRALNQGGDDAVAARAKELREVLARETRRDEVLDEIVARTRRRQVHKPKMVEALREIQRLLPLPTGLILHNFQYLADGRPVVWPAGFKGQCKAAARELGMPVYDPSPLVARTGVCAAMAEDLRHYARDFNETVADEYAAFAASILGRGIDARRAFAVASPEDDLAAME